MSAPKVFLGLVLFWTLACVMAPALIPNAVGRAEGQCAAIYAVGSSDAARLALDQACTPTSTAIRGGGLVDSILPWPWTRVWVMGIGVSAVVVIRYRDALRRG
jgi:hypothetical protein